MIIYEILAIIKHTHKKQQHKNNKILVIKISNYTVNHWNIYMYHNRTIRLVPAASTCEISTREPNVPGVWLTGLQSSPTSRYAQTWSRSNLEYYNKTLKRGNWWKYIILKSVLFTDKAAHRQSHRRERHSAVHRPERYE